MKVPAPQQQPQPQQQAQAQAAIALQQQEQPQLAYVNAARDFEARVAGEHAMTARSHQERPELTWGAAFVTLMAAGFALARERASLQRSRR